MQFTKEDIDKIINAKLMSLKTEESVSEKDDLGFPKNINPFISTFGLELELHRRDLTNFTGIVLLAVMTVIKQEKLKELQILLIDEGIKFFSKEEGESENKKIAECLEIFKPLIFPTKKNKAEDEEIDALSKEGMQELKVVQRSIAYFVFALYAYMDVYSNKLFHNFIKKSILKQKTSSTVEFPEKGGLKKKNRKVLQILKQELPGQLDDFFKKYQGLNDKHAMDLFIDLRNDIAHDNPLPELKNLRRKFPKHYKKAKDKRDAFVEKILVFQEFTNNNKDGEAVLSQKSKKKIASVLGDFFKDIHLFIFIIEIGFSCIRYLSVIEELVIQFQM